MHGVRPCLFHFSPHIRHSFQCVESDACACCAVCILTPLLMLHSTFLCTCGCSTRFFCLSLCVVYEWLKFSQYFAMQFSSWLRLFAVFHQIVYIVPFLVQSQQYCGWTDIVWQITKLSGLCNNYRQFLFYGPFGVLAYHAVCSLQFIKHKGSRDSMWILKCVLFSVDSWVQ